MADIELVIKIPEEIYKASQIIDVKYEDVIQIPLEVIAKGIPLDKIRAEIEELKPNNPNFKGYFEQNVALNKVLEVIDKYMGESEKE